MWSLLSSQQQIWAWCTTASTFSYCNRESLPAWAQSKPSTRALHPIPSVLLMTWFFLSSHFLHQQFLPLCWIIFICTKTCSTLSHLLKRASLDLRRPSSSASQTSPKRSLYLLLLLPHRIFNPFKSGFHHYCTITPCQGHNDIALLHSMSLSQTWSLLTPW